MKKRISLGLVLILLAVPAFAARAAAPTPFESACALLAQAAQPAQRMYTLFESGLDTVDATAAGKISLAQGVSKIAETSAALRTLEISPLNPSQELQDYMLSRGLSLEDYQATGSGAVTMAGYYADSLDGYVTAWQSVPGKIASDTTLMRNCLTLEMQMDFVAYNTIILPRSDEEAEAVSRLILQPVAFLREAGLPWERDMDVCLAKYDALEAEYQKLIDQSAVAIDTIQSAEDAAK